MTTEPNNEPTSTYDIGLQSGILDEKHMKQMGMAIWLYAWLIRKSTKNQDGVSLVLGGKPIKHSDVVELNLTRRTYTRYLAVLQKYGYIEQPKRTPYGLIIRVTKGKKVFKVTKNRVDNSGSSKVLERYAKNDTSEGRDVPDVAHSFTKFGTSNKENTVESITTHTKKIELLKIVNAVCNRNFRTLPERGVKKTLDTFSLDEIRQALELLVADSWHKERLSGLSIDYLVRSTTIDRFVQATAKATSQAPVMTPEEIEANRLAQAEELARRNANLKLNKLGGAV